MNGFNYKDETTWAVGKLRYEATIQFMRDLGWEVTAKPYGQR